MRFLQSVCCSCLRKLLRFFRALPTLPRDICSTLNGHLSFAKAPHIPFHQHSPLSLSLSPIHSLFSPHPIRARIRPVRQCKHLKSSLACQLKWQQQTRLGNTLWKGKRARGWLCKVKKKIQRLSRAEDVDERERIKEYVIENTLLT